MRWWLLIHKPSDKEGFRKTVRVGWVAGVREITKLTPDGLFGLLSSAPCGAFVLATDQTVVFWNHRAREILGYTPDLVVGRSCSRIAREAEGVTLTDDCEQGCLMVRNLRAGLVPSRARMRMRCSWGEWKWLVVTPMVVSGVEDGGPLMVYLFGDSDEEAVSVDIKKLVELGGGAVPRSGGPHYVRPANHLSDPRIMDDESFDDVQYRVRRGVEPDTTGDVDEPRDSGPASHVPGPRPSEGRLTQREREVLSYLALGWETRYIADELGVSWYTARNHIENLRRKLGASSRLEAVMIAMRRGIIPSE